MSSKEYIELDWEQSWPPLYGKLITIPKNTILWRSYDKSFPAIGDRFAYYSSQPIASGYKNNNSRELGHFISSRNLNLIDYRYMRVLLSRLIQMNTTNKATQYLASIMTSFGLCSLKHQIDLLKIRYRDSINKTNTQIAKSIKAMEKYYKPNSLLEQTGIRVAETTNDIFTMGFLQELFKGVFDGFISPRLYSPFHIEKDGSMMSPEIIIFNPKLSGIKELITYPQSSIIKTLSIIDLIHSTTLSTSGYIIIENIKKNNINMNVGLEFIMCGGNRRSNGEYNNHYLDEADDYLNNKDTNHTKIYKDSIKFGSKMKHIFDISKIETPTPTYKVSSWPLEI